MTLSPDVRVKDNNAYLAWGGEEAQDAADTPDSYKVYISEVGTSDGRSYLGLSTEKEYAIDVDNTASLKHFTEYYFQVRDYLEHCSEDQLIL